MLRLLTIVFLNWAISGTAASSEDQMPTESSPVFSDYGEVFKVPERDVPLKSNFTYKVIFDVAKAADNLSQLNRRINSVARFINMHAINGVELENMEIAVVLHGSATRDGLNHTAYQKRYKMSNPTLDLIKQLSAKGVKFYQCGQSAHFQQIAKSEFTKPVQLALSAMTMLVELQSAGYQLLP